LLRDLEITPIGKSRATPTALLNIIYFLAVKHILKTHIYDLPHLHCLTSHFWIPAFDLLSVFNATVILPLSVVSK